MSSLLDNGLVTTVSGAMGCTMPYSLAPIEAVVVGHILIGSATGATLSSTVVDSRRVLSHAIHTVAHIPTQGSKGILSKGVLKGSVLAEQTLYLVGSGSGGCHLSHFFLSLYY